MEATDIRKYAQLMQEMGLTRLEFNGKEQTLCLERSAPQAPAAPVVQAAAPAGIPAAPEAPADGGYISIRSPMVGLFYAAPAENAEPYVSVGDRIQKGQTLCIVEAMKLMNEVSAEEEGVIVEICAANGQMVEYGTELFRIRR